MEKSEALINAINQVEKQFGKGSVMILGDNKPKDVEVVSTGSLYIDSALGIGGLPKGRIIEIYGNESSGKTTLALHCIAEVQKKKGTAVFIDAEHALDVNYAKKIGVNVKDLILSQPDTGEQALDITEALIKTNAVDIIVIDSVASLVPKAELDGEMGDSHIGLQSRLMSQAMRKLTGVINKTNCIAVFINQVREKVGIIFGNPEVTSGGRALKFYSSIRLEVRRGEQIKNGNDVIGSKTNIKIVKNKLAAPFKQTQIEILYGEGISKLGEIIDIAVDNNIIIKSGSWFSYNNNKIGQGREKVKEFLKENPNILKEIEKQVKIAFLSD